MLRITTYKCFKTLRLTVEGRLEDPYVIELENSWQTTTPRTRSRIKVDITGVTFIDSGGQQLLTGCTSREQN